MNPVSIVPLIFLSFVKNWNLIFQLTKRNIEARFKGAALGVLWSFFTPILMLVVYTFVFGVILDIRWINQEGGNLEFATILFSGLIVHTYFSDCLQASTELIVSNRQYVKKVVFPLETLSWVAAFTALFQLVVSILVLISYLLIINQSLSWTIIFLPIIIFPLMIMALGFSWLISAVTVYVRDLRQIIGPLTLILLFVSPIFYPATNLPSNLRFLIYVNPISWVVDESRNLILWGTLPDLNGALIYYSASIAIAWFGLFCFKNLRLGFSDVI